jgi:hypothetical protein
VKITDEPGWYEIRFQGRLDDKWVVWFDGLALDPQPEGVTLLSGPVTDQAALHGVLARLRDLGLPLISVVRQPGRGATDP